MEATWKKNNLDNRSRKNGRIERLCTIRIWFWRIWYFAPLRPVWDWSWASPLKLERKLDARLTQKRSFLLAVAYCVYPSLYLSSWPWTQHGLNDMSDMMYDSLPSTDIPAPLVASPWKCWAKNRWGIVTIDPDCGAQWVLPGCITRYCTYQQGWRSCHDGLLYHRHDCEGGLRQLSWTPM